MASERLLLLLAVWALACEESEGMGKETEKLAHSKNLSLSANLKPSIPFPSHHVAYSSFLHYIMLTNVDPESTVHRTVFTHTLPNFAFLRENLVVDVSFLFAIL